MSVRFLAAAARRRPPAVVVARRCGPTRPEPWRRALALAARPHPRRPLSAKPAAVATDGPAAAACRAGHAGGAAADRAAGPADAPRPAAAPAAGGTSRDAAAPGDAPAERAPPPQPFLRRHWTHFLETMKQYWLGSKLLWLEVKTSSSLLTRVLAGHDLTRRERKQLTRTSADLMRLVPFSIFLIVPFMELLLPVALAVFPGMLPSTFQDSTKREEKAKATLRAQLALAGFLGDALGELRRGGRRKDGTEGGPSAAELADFVAKARAGEARPEDAARVAKSFGDDLMLDNLPRAQLVGLCQYMGLNPYGTDALLRYLLRTRIRDLRADDRRIVYEGLDTLTRQEMQEACADRGMRGVGLTKAQYHAQLARWLDLAALRELPIALLIMSQAFALQRPAAAPDSGAAERAIAESISALDADLVNEAVAAAATREEEDASAELKAARLLSLEQQNRLIAEERRDAADLEEKERDAERRRDGDDDDAAAGAVEAADAAALAAATPEAAAEAAAAAERRAAADADAAAEALFAAPADGAPSAASFSAKEKMEVAGVLVDMAYESALEREKDELAEVRAKLAADDDEAAAAEEAEAPSGVPAAAESPAEPAAAEPAAAPAAAAEAAADAPAAEAADEAPAPDGKVVALEERLERMTAKIAREIASVDERLGDRLHLIDRDNDGIVDVEEIRDALAAIALRQNKFREDPEALEAFIQVALREIDANSDDVITVEEVEKWFDSLEEEVEDQ